MSAPEATARLCRVVGLGSRDRGDDAVGPLVVDALRRRHPEVDATVCAEPSRLLDDAAALDLLVVVDAARSAYPPGTVQVLTDLASAQIGGDPASSHALGVVDVLALAEALDVAPRAVRLVAVTGASFGMGEPVSAAVEAAVDEVADIAAGLVCRDAMSIDGTRR